MVLVIISFVAAAGPLSAQAPPLPTEALCETLPVDLLGGCLLWHDRYEGPRAGDDGATDMALSPDGARAFVSGFSYQRGGSNTYDYVTLAYDTSTGERLWATEYAGPDANGGDARGEDFAMAVTVSPDSATVYVTGTSYGYVPSAGTSAAGVATIAYDAATGDVRWTARYQGAGLATDIGRDIVAGPNGTVHVVATLFGANNQDVGLLTYDAATGTLTHADVYTGPADRHDSVFFRSLAVAPDGSLYVGAQSYTDPSTGYDYALLRYDAHGTRIGASYHDSGEGGVERPFGIGLAADGAAVYITGQSRVAASGYDVATVAFDAQGNQIWVARHDATGATDQGYVVQVSPDGTTVAVAARSVGDGTGYDYLTLAYDAATGDETWSTRHDGPGGGHDVPAGIAFSGDGDRIHVTGSAAGAGQDQDATTLTYDAATGTELWRHSYAGTGQGDDAPHGMAVDPDTGVIYVTGDSYVDPLASYDVATYALTDGTGGLPLPPLPV